MNDTTWAGMWLALGVMAAAMFGVMLARSWRRAGRPHGVAATHCDVLGHVWEPYEHGRSCARCWEVQLDRPYDQETDVSEWEREAGQ